MRLHILSDLHLDHAMFSMPDVESDVLVLAGDILSPGHKASIWAARPSVNLGRTVLQLGGNHEFYDQTLQPERARMAETAGRTGVHLLDRTSVVIDGVRFLGCMLWTDYQVPIRDYDGQLRSDAQQGMVACAKTIADHFCISVQDFKGSRLVTPLDLLQEHLLDRCWLQEQLAMEFDGPTVVVTHHAPHHLSIAPRYADDWVTTGFVNALPDAFFEIPKLWIHGHTHSRFDYRVGNCRVVCNPRGYQMRDGCFEVPDFDPGFVIDFPQ